MDQFLPPAPLLDARRFDLAIRRLADALGHGTDRSIFRGAGLEYEQSRPYQAGDPVKAIDWRITGRTGKLHVKEYEAPRRIPVWLIVDTSASMTVGSRRPTKYETALTIAGGLALAGLERMRPVGCLCLGVRRLVVQPTLSRLTTLGWLHRLRHHRLDEPTAVAEATRLLEPLLAERSLVVVLSDLQDPDATARLGRLAQRHDVCALVFRDPAERGLRAGFLRAREAETGRTLTTRGRFAAEAAAERLADLATAGIDGLLIDTDRPYAARLRLFFTRRRPQGGRHP